MEAQEKYKEECQRVFDLQNRFVQIYTRVCTYMLCVCTCTCSVYVHVRTVHAQSVLLWSFSSCEVRCLSSVGQ